MAEEIPQWASDAIPTEEIDAFCDELQPALERQVRRFCDAAYDEILESTQGYLRDNAKYNIKSKFDAQKREVVSAHGALRAVEASTSLREAQKNARAARNGCWTPEKAAEYRAEAEALVEQRRTK
jgi:hypothetical protein